MTEQNIHRLSLAKRETMDTTQTLDELIRLFDRHMEASGRSNNTRIHYQYTFKDFAQFLADTNRAATLYSLNAEAIREFSIWLTDTPTRAWRGKTKREVQSIHGRLRDIRAFTRWLEDEEIIDRAPKISLPKLPERQFPILSEDQVHQLLECEHLTAAGPQAIRNRALIALMLDTGIRRSEAAGIEMRDLEIADQLIKIRGKGNKERRVPYSTGVVEALQHWVVIRGDEPGSLFWLTSRGIYSLFQRIQRETGLPIHPHQLRHQAATMMVRNNADLHTVKRILGHADLSTTEAYLSLSYDDLKAKHAAASPFDEASAGIVKISEIRRKRLTLR